MQSCQNVYVGNGCRLGNSVSIFSHMGLSDFVFCAPFMVFTYISFPRAAVNRRATFDKPLVEVGPTSGANSTVVPGITVASGTFLAAGSALTRDSKTWCLMNRIARAPSRLGQRLRRKGSVTARGWRPVVLPAHGQRISACRHNHPSRPGDTRHSQISPRQKARARPVHRRDRRNAHRP